ncbi:T-box protein VegT-B-like isoform X1 [Hydra vulgaris]|uniref:T-box protein VegT-B-like isoform X1 n=1 Tax=Hydra vulgaris TaxID=6087 RepID=UPI0032EA7ACB
MNNEVCVNKNASHAKVKAVLENRCIFEQFEKNTTEMVVTKQGRRMFPSPEITLSGLDPNTLYYVAMDFTAADNAKYKWSKENWVLHGERDTHWSSNTFVHPESPLLGSQWMKKIINFKTMKLTNSTSSSFGNIVLSSMHKYQPRVHVIPYYEVYLNYSHPISTFVFKECQFIAVTAYQNPKITDLKIKYNPFAKGFREQRKRKLPIQQISSFEQSIIKKRKKDKYITKQDSVDKDEESIFTHLILPLSEGLDLSAEKLIDELTIPGSTSRKNLELLSQPYFNYSGFNQTISEPSFMCDL